MANDAATVRVGTYSIVAWNNNGKVGQDAGEGNVFEPLVRGTVRTDRDTGMGTGDFNRYVVVANTGAQLVPVAARREDSIA